MKSKASNLRPLGLCAMFVVSLGCSHGKQELEEAAYPVAATAVQPALARTPPSKQELTALEAYLETSAPLLPETYAISDVYVSHLVSQFNDGSFDFNLARLSDAGFAMEVFSLSRKVGGASSEIFEKEVQLWEASGFLKCNVRVNRVAKPRAVLASDGRTALELSVNVTLTDIVDAVPSLKDSAFSRTLGYLMLAAHTEEKPLKYSATIVVAKEGERFALVSHGSEGQELTTEALQAIIRRNVMTLLSAEVVGLIKKAGAMVLFPEGKGITLERLQGFGRHQKQAIEKFGHEGIQAEEMRAAKASRDAIEDATRILVDAIPSRAVGVRIDVAFTRVVRDQLCHNVLDITVFDAAAHLWELQAAASRGRPGYSARQLAKDAAAMIHEFGVATVTCDLEIQRPSFEGSTLDFRFPVTYRVVSIDRERPRATSSWIAAATWAALPKQGSVTLNFPVDSKGPSALRIGYDLPVGALFGRVDPVTAWGHPADVLSPQSVLNAARRAVAESLAVDCERAAKEAIDLSTADRIQESSFLYGGIECLPEATPKEDGIDLALLNKIADEMDSGVYWEKRLTGVVEADQDVVTAVFKRLATVLKPKKWTSKLNERIVASPVFLSDTHVMFDLGVGQPRIGVTRDACKGEGARLLDRIEKIAIECVVKLSDAARSRDGVQIEQADAAWRAVSQAVRCLVAGNRGESQEAVSRLAAVYAALESNSATEEVRGDIARCAAAAVKLSPNPSGGDGNSRLLQPFLTGESDASAIRPGLVARVEMLLALGEITHCRDVAEKAVGHNPGTSELCDYGRIAWALGSAQMADEKPAQAVEWLQKAIDAFAESRGKDAMPPAELLQDLGTALVAAGQPQKGEHFLKESRRILLLTYGKDDSKVKQFDTRYPMGKPTSTD